MNFNIPPKCPKCQSDRDLDCGHEATYLCGTWLVGPYEDLAEVQSGECKVRANLVEIREETQKWINGYFSAGGLSSQDFAHRILAISSRDLKESNA